MKECKSCYRDISNIASDLFDGMCNDCYGASKMLEERKKLQDEFENMKFLCRTNGRVYRRKY